MAIGIARKLVAALVLVVSTPWLLVSCAVSAEEETGSSGFLFEHLKMRTSTASSVNFDHVLGDWLPNQLYRIDGQAPHPLGAGIVFGKIANVEAGRAYTVEGDAETGSEVPYESGEALWRTVDVTLTVDQAWMKTESQGKVRFGLSIDGAEDPNKIMSSIRSLGPALVVLAGTGFFQYDRTLYNVGRNGTLIGTVSTTGTINFPALDTDEVDDYLADTPNLTALEDKAKGIPPVISVENGARQ